MSIIYNIIALLGGLAMFLYGMKVMGDGLKSISGAAMKDVLAKVTNKPVLGFLFGVLVTCVIQSSTATIVLTVGLVGAGFLTFEQSIGIVLGANVGTAITAQIIRLMDVQSSKDSFLYFFKADNLAPLALIIGIIFIMFIKSNSSKNTGAILCGFGVLFMGLIYMSSSVSSFSDKLTNLLLAFEDSYILQFGSGVVVTGIIQSSSAVIGILQSIASSIGVTFSGVFAIIIGVNIGDCLTTFLVSRIGANPAQKRTALVHVIYNIFAACLIIVSITVLRKTGVISDEIWLRNLNSGGVANIHGLFRLIPAIVLLPISKLFSKIATKICPDLPIDPEDEEIIRDLQALDNRLLQSPTLALYQSGVLISRMASVSNHNFEASVDQLFNFDPGRDKRMEDREKMIDKMADRSNNYIIEISNYITTDSDVKKQNFQLKSMICFERIGDLAINIKDAVCKIRENNMHFSPNAMAELKIVTNAVSDILKLTVDSFINMDYQKAKEVEPLEEVIDDLVEALNNRHIKRMQESVCDGLVGIQFQNILTNLEHISDKCSDLAVYILEQKDDSILGNEHTYIHELHHSDNTEYRESFNRQNKKYMDLLNVIPTTGDIK